MSVAASAIDFLVEGLGEKTAIVETGERIGYRVAMKAFQFVVFKYDWNAEQSLGGQHVDQCSLKRNRCFRDTGKVGSAEQHVIPKGNGLIFGNFDVGESQEKALQKWSTRTRLEAFECVND